MTIRDIRSTIFDLQLPHDTSLRGGLHAWSRSTSRCSASRPWCGPAARWTRRSPQATGAQLLAVLREALSNVARHAEADAAVVEVEAAGSEVTLRVTDNGQGCP